MFAADAARRASYTDVASTRCRWRKGESCDHGTLSQISPHPNPLPHAGEGAHSFNFAATMQADNPHARPVLIRIETRAGHGQGKPTAMQIDETADVYAFILKSFGLAH